MEPEDVRPNMIADMIALFGLKPAKQEVLPRCTIECERIINTTNPKQTTTPSHIKMDAVIHYITTLPLIRNLLCVSNHEYLPNEFEPIQVEPDVFFQLLNFGIEPLKF